jgi:hypothetical protein
MFGFSGADPSAEHLEVISSAAVLESARQALGRTLPNGFWMSVSRAISRALEQALQVDLTAVLVGGWNTYRSLLEYADRSKHSPEEIAELALGRHSIASSHEPRVTLLVGGKKVAEVPFEVELELEIESAIFTIQDARIREVALGRCAGKGSLKCSGAVLLERKSGEVMLPGRIVLGEGIPIAARRQR